MNQLPLPLCAPRTIVGFSGGKDSTALALEMAARGEDFELLFTPTGNELPDLWPHLRRVVEATGKRLVMPPGPTLSRLIMEMRMLPSTRARWCTRLIKIEPCIAYLLQHPGSTLCVGLRADEEQREGLYGPYATYRYPLQEWGWDLRKVMSYCVERGFEPPPRTDCAVCPYQRIADWFWLWRKHPAEWEKAKRWERVIGHTFRSPSRDTWPAALADMEEEFRQGRPIRGYDADSDVAPCRVCRL